MNLMSIVTYLGINSITSQPHHKHATLTPSPFLISGSRRSGSDKEQASAKNPNQEIPKSFWRRAEIAFERTSLIKCKLPLLMSSQSRVDFSRTFWGEIKLKLSYHAPPQRGRPQKTMMGGIRRGRGGSVRLITCHLLFCSWTILLKFDNECNWTFKKKTWMIWIG